MEMHFGTRRTWRYARFLLAAAAFVAAIPALSAQQVARLQIDYRHPYTRDGATSEKWKGGLPAEVRQQLVSLDVYIAQGTESILQTFVMKVRYVPSLMIDLDKGAQEAISQVSALDGMSNVQSKVVPLTVSGFEARRISFTANRRGGRIGVEFLIVCDRKANEVWQVQMIVGKTKPINPLSSLNIDEERKHADALLKTVKLAPR